jgi:hypothetical protein
LFAVGFALPCKVNARNRSASAGVIDEMRVAEPKHETMRFATVRKLFIVRFLLVVACTPNA